MNSVPPPDPEVMKNCIVNTGDLLIFQFDLDGRDSTRRPMTAEEILALPQDLIEQVPAHIIRQRLTPEQVRRVRPDLAAG